MHTRKIKGPQVPRLVTQRKHRQAQEHRNITFATQRCPGAIFFHGRFTTSYLRDRYLVCGKYIGCAACFCRGLHPHYKSRRKKTHRRQSFNRFESTGFILSHQLTPFFSWMPLLPFTPWERAGEPSRAHVFLVPHRAVWRSSFSAPIRIPI